MSKQFTIIGLGEALWDLFPEGPRFGGAPANFACHAAMLGGSVYMVSRVGDDALGEQAIASLGERGVDTRYVDRGPFPTGSVKIELDAAGQPRYEICQGVAWDHLEWSEDLDAVAADTYAVCFGTLCQRSEMSRTTIQRFLAATCSHWLRIFDVNLRQSYYDREVILDSLHRATGLKLNDEELPIVASMCGVTGTERDVLAELARRFGLGLVALTRGSRGAMLLAGDTISECAAPAVVVKDTVGAGDAFTAAMALGWLRGHDLAAIGKHACEVAAFVCTQTGATPALPKELTAPYPDVV